MYGFDFIIIPGSGDFNNFLFNILLVSIPHANTIWSVAISPFDVIIEEMTSVVNSDQHSFSIPLTVDLNIGNNWGSLH